MIKRYGDIFSGVVLLVVTWFYYQGTFMELKFKLSKYGAEFVPRIYCLIMAAVAAGLIARGILHLWRNPNPGQVPPIDKKAATKVMLTIGVIVVYLLTMRPLGFVLSTVIYLILQVLVTAPRAKFKPVAVVAFAVFVACSLNYLFLHVFYLALPAGIFTF